MATDDHHSGGAVDANNLIFIYKGGQAPAHITHARLASNLTTIPPHAFEYCIHLTHIETHNNLLHVGKYAFHRCHSLHEINLTSTEVIDEGAFWGCTNLSSVQFGNRLKQIGQGAFSNCTSIQRLIVPKNYVLWNPNLGVTIDKCAFIDCVELTDVELGGYSKIEQGVFHGCRHLRLKISGRTVVDDEFTGTSGLSYVEYSNELLSVGSHSFARCASLKGVMMPSVTTLGQYAFSDCGTLKSVKLPSILTIGAWAFNECRDMSELELPAVLEQVEEFALNGCRSLERITIPLKDNLISDNVFTNCDELIKVDLVGDVHETLSAFFLDSSRNDVEEQILQINRELLQNKRDRKEKKANKENIPDTTGLIQRWIRSTLKLCSEKKAQESKFLRQAFKGGELSSRSFFAPKLTGNEEEHVGQKEEVMVELRQTIVKVAHDKPYEPTEKEKKREEKKKKKAEKERKKKEAEGAGGVFNSLSALAAGVFQSSS